MTTDIKLASNALLLLGEDVIQSLDDDTAASNLYDATYESLLAMEPWTFAMKEQDLSRNTAAPDDKTGFQYSFNLPSDLLRVWEMMPYCDYAIIGNEVQTNEPELRLRYIYRVSETAIPSHFAKLVEYKLASEFAISVSEDENRAALFEQKFKSQLNQARKIDAQGVPTRGIRSSPFANPYYTGSGEFV
jgi:hypothetical protein